MELKQLRAVGMDQIVQINLNRQRRSTDLLLQFMRENQIAMAVISEPNSVPDDPGWVGSLDGKATITWRGTVRNMECALVARGEGYCMVSWGDWYICAYYFSPNHANIEFMRWLNDLGTVLLPYTSYPVLILGDFNARSLVWDVNGKGDLLSE